MEQALRPCLGTMGKSTALDEVSIISPFVYDSGALDHTVRIFRR